MVNDNIDFLKMVKFDFTTYTTYELKLDDINDYPTNLDFLEIKLGSNIIIFDVGSNYTFKFGEDFYNAHLSDIVICSQERFQLRFRLHDKSIIVIDSVDFDKFEILKSVDINKYNEKISIYDIFINFDAENFTKEYIDVGNGLPVTIKSPYLPISEIIPIKELDTKFGIFMGVTDHVIIYRMEDNLPYGYYSPQDKFDISNISFIDEELANDFARVIFDAMQESLTGQKIGDKKISRFGKNSVNPFNKKNFDTYIRLGLISEGYLESNNKLVYVKYYREANNGMYIYTDSYGNEYISHPNLILKKEYNI